MGRKICAAKASLVAAFLASSGAATAKSVAAADPASVPGAASPSSAADPLGAFFPKAKLPVSWGDPLIRFLKLDGFPAYLKVDDFARLTHYYKAALLSDAAVLYDAWPSKIQSLLDVYQKADAGLLAGILIGLEQYNKYGDEETLLEYLQNPAALDAYIKWQEFFDALRTVGREENGGSAFEYFYKLTGIRELPAV
jgi:hypothetical protein